jgi:hypothetical protein
MQIIAFLRARVHTHTHTHTHTHKDNMEINSFKIDLKN